MWTRAFWRQATERGVKTAAQALLLLWLVGDVAFNILTVEWGNSLGTAVGGFVISVLTSIVSAGVGPEGSPSMVSTATPPPVVAARHPETF